MGGGWCGRRLLKPGVERMYAYVLDVHVRGVEAVDAKLALAAYATGGVHLMTWRCYSRRYHRRNLQGRLGRGGAVPGQTMQAS